jgi:hypothetical protein
MTVLLHQQGLFTWTEWAQALSAQIAAGQAPQVTVGQGSSTPVDTLQAYSAQMATQAPETPYYQHWLAALEQLVAAKGLSSHEELTRYQRAWETAAHRTPHGMSIDLQSEDIGR